MPAWGWRSAAEYLPDAAWQRCVSCTGTATHVLSTEVREIVLYQTACQFGVSPLEEAPGLKFLPPVLSARSFS
jgi:hypothetical protein